MDGPESLMKGKLFQSQNGEGEWHVTDRLSDAGSQQNDKTENGTSKDTFVVNPTKSMDSSDDLPERPTSLSLSAAPIDFLKDDVRDMTFARRIALSLIDKKWYNPKAGETKEKEGEDKTNDGPSPSNGADDPEGKKEASTIKACDFDDEMHCRQPNLEKAWAYFEHVALYRYLVPPDEGNKQKKNICVRAFRKLFMKGNKKFEKAEPGEDDAPTRLYSPIFTPHKQLGDFGLGIGLYFSTLRAFAIITFVAGLFSIYNIMYFASDDYLPYEYQEKIPTLTIGSAICMKTSYVPCETCDCLPSEGNIEFGQFPPDRCAIDPNTNQTFVLRNDCDATPWQLGAVNFGSVIFLLVATMLLGRYLKHQEVQFDEDEQTAQDYSVKISNPPPDAKDPDEWKRFFQENCDGAHVTVCTIAVDNDFLVRTLVERRERLRTIANMQEPGSSMNMLDLARVAAQEERKRNFWQRLLAMVAPGIPEHFSRLVALNAKVEGLAQLDFPVTNIFLTFETEKDQRNVLTSLSVGSLKADRNDTKAVSDPKYLFRGKHVLNVSEADEPNTVRWQDLNAGAWQKFKERAFTMICTIVAIVLVAFLIDVVNNVSSIGAAFTISIFNTAFPMFAKILTGFEAHPSEGQKQTSLYFKIAVFRWVSTAVIFQIITPFTRSLMDEGGLITQVYALFFADIVTTNALQLADVMGHLKRHILAPRAATQDAMNLNFQGTEYELAERYTDMTKILFLCLWYCSIYPGSFFLCSFSLGIKYFVDRFCLMRSWKKAPQLGAKISLFSRRYFFTMAIGVMAIISSYYWSGFPFDNLCPNDSINSTYEGSFTIFPLDQGNDGTGINVTFTPSDVDYRFCNQNFMEPGSGFTFPFVPTSTSENTNPLEWMTDDQITTTTYFGWAALGIAGVVVLRFFYGWFGMFMSLFKSSYSAVGDDQNIPFSKVASRSAYIPQVASPLFAYPLVACNTDKIDEELYDWEDSDRDYRYYDLSKDAKKLLSGLNVEEPPGFSVVRHYPPPSEN